MEWMQLHDDLFVLASFYVYLIFQSIKTFEYKLKQSVQVLRTWWSHEQVGISVSFKYKHIRIREYTILAWHHKYKMNGKLCKLNI